MGEILVQAVNVLEAAVWDYKDSAPHVRLPGHNHSATFDPFPAYAHDLGVARASAELVAERCPPLWDVDLIVTDREEVGRTNAFSTVTQGGHYDADDNWVKDPPRGLMVFCGKRIPPHPAMTRYLAAHEYGHNVQYMLNWLRKPGNVYEEGWLRQYIEMRGLPPEAMHHGSGGRWHDSIGEIFACDFRVIVCGVELEFWPHAGVDRPEDVKALAGWWETALGELAEAQVSQGR